MAVQSKWILTENITQGDAVLAKVSTHWGIAALKAENGKLLLQLSPNREEIPPEQWGKVTLLAHARESRPENQNPQLQRDSHNVMSHQTATAGSLKYAAPGENSLS